MTQAKSIVEQLIDSLSDCYSKLSLDQYSQAVVSKLIQQILKTYLYYESPTNLLVKALKEDESKLISKINPVLEIYSIFQLLENHNEEVSLITSSTINHNFWSWLDQPQNRELMKIKSIKSLLNTIQPFCEIIKEPIYDENYLKNYLHNIVALSNQVSIIPSQFNCMRCSRILRKQHPILDIKELNSNILSKNIIYPWKLLLEPVIFTELSIDQSIVGTFIGKQGKDIKQIQQNLEIICDAYQNQYFSIEQQCELIVIIKILESSNNDGKVVEEINDLENYGEKDSISSDIKVIVGAWITDDKLINRIEKRILFPKFSSDSLSEMFELELKNSIAKIEFENSSQNDHDNLFDEVEVNLEEGEYGEYGECVHSCFEVFPQYWQNMSTGEYIPYKTFPHQTMTSSPYFEQTPSQQSYSYSQQPYSGYDVDTIFQNNHLTHPGSYPNTNIVHYQYHQNNYSYYDHKSYDQGYAQSTW